MLRFKENTKKFQDNRPSVSLLAKVFRKKSVRIFVLALLAWCISFVTDFVRATHNRYPIFAITHSAFVRRDGGSKEFFGIGYKIIFYVARDTYTGEILFGEIDHVEIGTWFLSFSR